MPFVMPVVAVTQYILILRNDLEEFCYEDSDDAEKMRRKYEILSQYETKNNRLIEIAESLRNDLAQQQKMGTFGSKVDQKVI